MLRELITRLDEQLRSQKSKTASKANAGKAARELDVLVLEERILYSAVPMVEAADAPADTDAHSATTDSSSQNSSSHGTDATGSGADAVGVNDQSNAGNPSTDAAEDTSEYEAVWDGGSASAVDVSRELIFIDTSVQDFHQLLDDIVSQGDPTRQMEVVFVDPTRDGIEQISEALAGRTSIDAIHIVSHGSEGQVQLGSSILNNDSLANYSGEIAGWASSLDSNADLQLHGCDMGSEDGKALIDSIAVLCNCVVNANEQFTSNEVNATQSDTTHGQESEVVFIQTGVADYQALVADIEQNALDSGRKMSIFVLNGTEDGYSQIDHVLAQYTNLDAIHFVSHGSVGMIQLGGSWLTAGNIDQYQAQLQTWGMSLSESGDILIYGCDVAAGPEGQAFIDRVAELTRADVAASMDKTGDISRGGDWSLEYVSTAGFQPVNNPSSTGFQPVNSTDPQSAGYKPAGTIESQNPFSLHLQSSYGGLLATYTVRDDFESALYTNNNGTNSWSAAWSETDAAGSGATTGNILITGGQLQMQAANAADLISRQANLTGAHSATLSFTYDNTLDNNASNSSITVDVSSDGVTWVTLDTFSKTLNTTASSKSYDITSYISSGTRVRFDVGTAAAGSFYLFVDNFQISYDINTSPVLNASASPTMGLVLEGATNPSGVTVADLVVDGSITDTVGSAVEAIAITALNTSLGTWQYSLDDGGNWLDIDTASINSTANELALLLGPTAQLRLVPTGDLNGSLNDAITFRAWDMSSGGEGQYVVITSAGGSTSFSSASDTASITVTAVDNAPTFTNTLGGAVAYTEGGTPVVLDSNVQVFDAESSISNFSGSTLTLSRSGGANSQDLFSATGTLGALTQGSSLTIGGITIGTVTTNSNGTLTLTFNSNATNTLVNSAMQQIAYANSSDAAPANIQIAWTMTTLPPLTFTDVTAIAGVGDTGNGIGTAWGDYDCDGDLDLYVVNYGQANILYRNNGDGTFTDVTALAGVGHSAATYGGALWGDYDGDGHLDLYLTNHGQANVLYRNNGDGTFTDNTATAGVGHTGIGFGTASSDYDGDGDLDLYITNIWSANVLYRNNGNGTFTDVAAAAGVSAAGVGSRGASWGDYDGDGRLDLYVTNSGGANTLFRNNGDGTFTNVTAAAGVAHGGNSQGAVWGDYDGDGYLDLYVANLGGHANGLYRNNGDGTFTNVATAAGVDYNGWTPRVAWADVDNDGRLDLYLNNGSNLVYRNNGDGSFTNITTTAGVGDVTDGYSAVWGDVDVDGDLDLYVANFGANVLYLNNTNPAVGTYLQVAVRRDGVLASGLTVELMDGDTRVATRTIDGGSGRGAQNATPVHFAGLNPATSYSIRYRSADGTLHTTLVGTPSASMVTVDMMLPPPAPNVLVASPAAHGLTATGNVIVNITAVNDAPVAVADTATAVEAGGTSNGTAGTNPTGNVLANDTDVDAGDTKEVIGVSAGVQASAAGNVASSVTGSFGIINIAADGSYSYTVDNSNATVQALRTGGNTLTDTFTYTMQDSGGLTSTTQVTVTIQGANDAPIAVSDSTLANFVVYASGSVEYLVVAGGGGGGARGGGGGGAGGLLSGTLINFVADAYAITVGSGGAGDANSEGRGRGSNGTNSIFSSLTAIGGGGGGGGDNLSSNSNGANGGSGGGGGYLNSGQGTTGGTGIAGQGFAGGTGGKGNRGLNGAEYNGGGGGGAGAVGGANNHLNPPTAGKGGDGVLSSINGTSIYYAGGGGGGAYPLGGSLANIGGLGGGGDGQYNAAGINGTTNLGSGGGGGGGESGTGGAGGSGVVIVRYRTDGSDGISTLSTGGTITTWGIYTIHTFNTDGIFVSVSSSPLNSSGNVLTNDTDVDSGDTKTVSGVAAGVVGSASSNVGSNVTGSYGSITIAANGGYSYTADTSNAAYRALRTASDTINDVFTYTITDTAGLTSTTQLTITLQGTNDAPVAVADTATAVEAGGTSNGTAGTNPTGNVLTNDTDVDAGDTKTVTGIVAGTFPSAAANVGSNVAGTYGTITIAANGAYTYTVDHNNASVQALRTAGDTLNDVFTYTMQDSGGLTSTTQITVTIQGANDAPVASDNSAQIFVGEKINISAAQGLLANASDVNGDSLTAVLIAGPGTGNLTLQSDGSWSYEAPRGFFGLVSFSYAANDGFANSSPATVTILVSIGGGAQTPTAPLPPPSQRPEPEPESELESELESEPSPKPDPTQISRTPNPPTQQFIPDHIAGASTSVSENSKPEEDRRNLDPKDEDLLYSMSALAATKSHQLLLHNLQTTDLYSKPWMPFSEKILMFKDYSEESARTKFIVANDDLQFNLNQFHSHEDKRQETLQLTSGTATTLFVGASAGIAAWCAGGPFLVSLASSSLPTWASFDVTYIANNPTRTRKEEDTSVAQIIAAGQPSEPGSES